MGFEDEAPWLERQVRVLEMRLEEGFGREELSPVALVGLRMGARGCGVEALMGTGGGVLVPEERAARDSVGSVVEEEEDCDELPLEE